MWNEAEAADHFLSALVELVATLNMSCEILIVDEVMWMLLKGRVKRSCVLE
jgi:hypothetical protein